MGLLRLFTTEQVKGKKNYINSQKVYEIVRTILYFGISISLLIGGYIATKTRANLLTIVAVLGCLPACKSFVSAFMFCRYKSLEKNIADRFEDIASPMLQLFDMVFTSSSKNYVVNHIVIKGNMICGYSEKNDFDEKGYYEHIQSILKKDNLKDITIKIFTNQDKYIQRIAELKVLEVDSKLEKSIASTLKSVSL